MMMFTLGHQIKIMMWREGKHQEVIEYCLKDTQLTYDLYMLGKENSMLKSRCVDTGDIKEVILEW